MKFFDLAAGENTLRISLCTDKIIRFTYGTKLDQERESFIITADFDAMPAVKADVADGDDAFTVTTDSVRVIIDKKTWNLRFERPDGEVLSRMYGHVLEEYKVYRTVGGKIETKETVDGVHAKLEDGELEFQRFSNHAKLNLRFAEDEELYGLGSHEEGYPSLKGQFVPLYQENMRIAVPYIVSTKGYSCLFDCASHINFDGTDRRYGRFYFDSVDVLDWYFIVGDDFDDVCRGYRTLTGVTPMLPKWAVGYVQSRERYVSQAHILETAEEYRKLSIPIDCIVQDWQTWPGDLWGYKHFDPERYPDPQGMMDQLHGMHMHMLLSIWPNMNGDSENRREFQQAGKMLGNDSVYDAFDPEGRAIYWKQTNEGIFRYGIDGWWCDCSEPFETIWGGEERPPLPERMKISTDTFKKYLDDSVINAYSLFHSRGIYEGQRATTEEKRVINMTRSGFAGQHRYAAIVWSGDISATWETLAKQVGIAQNYIACGEAYWNSDAGGFFVRQWNQWFGDGDYPTGKDDLGFRELYTRWLQFAGFTPFMRSHGTDTPREVWQFGERGTMFRDAIEETIALRYKLAPYFYSCNAAVTFDGTMPITALGLAFPHDRTARKTGGQYMYGHEFLVCPVTHPMHYRAGSEKIEH
ncbi:MAG: DUF4968 domain-containing protein, partial [Clostridia bacterium]|nr:DUF4968 domain-containing protein [Clostridia bacterium]